LRSDLLAFAAALLVGSAATAQTVTVEVPALRETTAVASARDAADDPAIWRNPRNPAKSLIVATDKQEGLYVYGLDGRTRSKLAAGRVNNVDLRAGVEIKGRRGVLVAASDRTDRAHAKLALFRLDARTARLKPLGVLPIADGEAYGVCLWRRKADGALFAFNVLKDGRIVQARLDLSGAAPRAVVVRRTAKLATQSEGCVADDRTGQLYVAEEDVGVWRLSADPGGGPPESFARVDHQRLFDDAEGVAVVPEGKTGGYLVVSSQGDSAYAVYRLEDGAFAGRFRIVGANAVDGTSETDGIEIASGGFGPGLDGGLMIAQDGDNAPEAQNFKLVSWARVKAALGLR
jgi:3-phytase